MTEVEKAAFYVKIGENIQFLRKQRGMKQQTLAELLDLSRVSVVNIEKGRQHVTIHTLWEICNHLDTNLSELTTGLSRTNYPRISTQRMKFDDSFTSDAEKNQVREGIDLIYQKLTKGS